MREIEELNLETRWIKLAARRYNPTGGERVIALHGWLDNAAGFQPLAEVLPELDLMALDLAGHGRSEHRPPGQHYHFVDFVADTVAAADSLGWERFSLLGHSMGAGIASLLAASFPQRVTHLILIEGLGPWGDDPKACASHLAEATRQILTPETPSSRITRSLEAVIRARMRAGNLSEDSARLLVERNTCQDPAGNLCWRTDPRLRFRSPIYITEEQTRAFLAAIRAPTLFIHDRDQEPPHHYHWRQRQALINDIQVTGLTGGHHLHMERPQPVADRIRRFLDTSPNG
ncbi:MAG: alpha/beta hydrolase [Sedimenticola sp.]|nr:alpha/beta hydrolase [Sedimenticola sp.]